MLVADTTLNKLVNYSSTRKIVRDALSDFFVA